MAIVYLTKYGLGTMCDQRDRPDAEWIAKEFPSGNIATLYEARRAAWWQSHNQGLKLGNQAVDLVDHSPHGRDNIAP